MLKPKFVKQFTKNGMVYNNQSWSTPDKFNFVRNDQIIVHPSLKNISKSCRITEMIIERPKLALKMALKSDTFGIRKVGKCLQRKSDADVALLSSQHWKALEFQMHFLCILQRFWVEFSWFFCIRSALKVCALNLLENGF